MDFERFINEKLADDLDASQLDYYWKAIHAFNSWKKNQRNSEKVKGMLDAILDKFNLDARARAKVSQLSDTVDTFMRTGELTFEPIKHRTRIVKEPEHEADVNTDDDESFQKVKIDKDFCEKAFHKFNEKYFGNRLDDIPFEVKPLGHANGQFVFLTDFREKKYIPKRIQMNSSEDWTFGSFRNTLVHEMLHYYVYCYDSPVTESDWNEAVRYYFAR